MTITLNSSASAPTVESSSDAFSMFVLEQIRCARLRAETTANQCEMAAAALSAGIVTPEMALLVLHETRVELGESSS